MLLENSKFKVYNMTWENGLKKKQTKFGLQRTLDGENIINLDPIQEAIEEKKRSEEAEAQRKKREAERLAVANREGQENLEKGGECIDDADLRIDRFEELIEVARNLITLVKRADSSPNRSFNVEIAEAYNTLIGTYNEIYADMFCFKNQLNDE
jgi:hypothetical protein